MAATSLSSGYFTHDCVEQLLHKSVVYTNRFSKPTLPSSGFKTQNILFMGFQASACLSFSKIYHTLLWTERGIRNIKCIKTI